MSLKTRYLLGAAMILALGIPALAAAAGEGEPAEGGARNPSADQRQAYTRETEIIAETNTYGTRQSNKTNNGGGAIYGCRSRAGGTPTGNEPCLRANNLSAGRAFEFVSTNGNEAGRIETKDPNGKPFTTNATGVADGLNADRVDGKNADDIRNEAVAAAGQAAEQNNRFVSMAANGTIDENQRRGIASAERTGTGVYSVVFAADVNRCAYQSTVIGGEDGGGTAWVEPVDARTLRVRTVGATGADADTPADRAFHLTVTC